jgi:hypothetical protein
VVEVEGERSQVMAEDANRGKFMVVEADDAYDGK